MEVPANTSNEEDSGICFKNAKYRSWQAAHDSFVKLKASAVANLVWHKLRTEHERPEYANSPFVLKYIDCGQQCQLRNLAKFEAEHAYATCLHRSGKQLKLEGVAALLFLLNFDDTFQYSRLTLNLYPILK
jgi:hypothetical protein